MRFFSTVFIFLFVTFNGVGQSSADTSLPDFRVEKYQNGSIRFVLSEVNEVLNSTQDSIQAFKEHAISFAQENEPEIAAEYILKYIGATTDLSILNDHLFSSIKDSPSYKSIIEQY